MESIQGEKMNIPAIEGGTPVRDTYLPFSPPDITEKEIQSVVEVLKSGWITRGKKCEEFERLLATYTGADHAVVLSSATAGLFLSLKIHGIGEGDEVITTPYTFAATANVVLHTGARPVFADIDVDTFLISPEEIRSKISPRTRAIIPVHFAGHPADMQEISRIADDHGLLVIEDAAHAVGATYRGKKIGNGERAAVFSFHAVKNLTTAEGGAVMTGDEEFARQLRLFSLHGQTKDAAAKLLAGGWKYDIVLPGFKLNMTDLQAAIGIEQLKRLDMNRQKREAVVHRYSDFFRQFDIVKTPGVHRDVTHAWHLYPLRIDFSKLRIDRDAFITALAKENISANVHFIPVHLMSYYKKYFRFRPSDFPASYSTYLQEVSLPVYPTLTHKDTQDVCEACARLLNYYKK